MLCNSAKRYVFLATITTSTFDNTKLLLAPRHQQYFIMCQRLQRCS